MAVSARSSWVIVINERIVEQTFISSFVVHHQVISQCDNSGYRLDTME